MSISVCVPSRGRPERFAHMYASLLETKGTGDVEVLVVLDSDDPTREQYPKGPVYVTKEPGPASTDLWNIAWAHASGEVAMLGADDIEFQTPGWNDRVEEAFELWPDTLGMVYTNDMHPITGWNPPIIGGWFPGGSQVEWKGRMWWKDEQGLVWPTHPFVSRKWIEAVGYFTPPYFSPTWEADTWIFLVAQEVRRLQYLPDVHIEHLHPMNGTAEMDETYAKGTWANPRLKALGERKLRSRPMALLRQQQAIALQRAMQPEGPLDEDIPHIVHQVWLGPRPRPVAWMDTWKQVNPDWEYRLWTEKEVGALGLKNRPLYERLLRRKSYDACSDVIRAEVLERFGGIYVDADSRALKPLDGAPFLRSRMFLMSHPPDSSEGRWLNGCFMGCAPGAKTMQEYVRALSAVGGLGQTWRTVGPGLLTKIVSFYGGADILEPEVFFPTEMSDGYGEHFWGATAGQKSGFTGKPYAASRSAKDLSFLVAWRDDDGSRTEAWEFLKARLKRNFPDAQIVIGTDDGPIFNKCKALNRAARQAKGEVFCIWDADSWVQPWLIHEARDVIAGDPKEWVKPWKVKRRLDEATTLRVLEQGEAWDGECPPRSSFENVNTFRHSPPVLLHRDLWKAIGGMDERFVGWGGEDSAFSFTMEALFGSPKNPHGEVVHLWHPRIGKVGHDLWAGQESTKANDLLYKRYAAAQRNPKAIRDLIDSRRSG